MIVLQELHLVDICPHKLKPGYKGKGGMNTLTRLEYYVSCRRQFGIAVREVVSQLPSLRRLAMKGVKAEDPGHDFAILHPWKQLE